ncbi:MAG TPA: hypothetical protein VI248_26640 [Kineosporiaceae bacterium]
MSPELAPVLRGMPAAASRTARLDRDLLALADGVADAGQRARLAELVQLLATPDAARRCTHGSTRRTTQRPTTRGSPSSPPN